MKLNSLVWYMLLALMAIGLLSSCVAAKDYCIDKAFTAKAKLADPKKSFDDTYYIYFDHTANKQRLDVHVKEPVRQKFQLYARYDLGKGYQYDIDTKKCFSFPLPGKHLDQFCLAQSAKHVKDIVLGGVLKCQVWEAEQEGFDLTLVLAPSGSFGVPVNIVTRSGAAEYTTIFQEWFDFKGYETLPDQSVFELPEECKGKAEEEWTSTSDNTLSLWSNPVFQPAILSTKLRK